MSSNDANGRKRKTKSNSRSHPPNDDENQQERRLAEVHIDRFGFGFDCPESTPTSTSLQVDTLVATEAITANTASTGDINDSKY
jgi:hypothetical protein